MKESSVHLEIYLCLTQVMNTKDYCARFSLAMFLYLNILVEM